MTGIETRALVQALLDDRLAGFRYLRERGGKQAGESATRFRAPDSGMLVSYANAIKLAVRHEAEEE
jgi:hypothetical protein